MKKITQVSLSVLLALSSIVSSSDACTRMIYEAGNDRFITTRSMDWETNIPTSLWVFPKGIAKNGGIDDNSIKWTSEYGSVVSVGFDSVTADGMNEKGLVANLLYLTESDFGTSTKPTLSIGAFTQYVLDNFANVSEAVKGMKNLSFQIIAPNFPDGAEASLHLAISDKSGDSAVFEFIKGKLVIHHSKDYKVMTNSPTFDQQLSINDYWKEVGGKAMLPGTSRPSDRFARASFYTNSAKKVEDERQALSTAVSIARNASVPFSVYMLSKEKIAPTLWRSISDTKALKYYFDSAVSPSIFWVDIKKLNLKDGASIKKLELPEYPNFSGEVSSKFIATKKPFEWLH